MVDVQYRSLEEVSDLERVVDLEITIWQVDSREAAPSSILHAHVASGGLVVGAFDGDRMVGVALAFPGRRGTKVILWSHMVGVLPEYQSQGIGFGLKQFQRSWALGHGYKTIVWTFDPLQAGNANFNVRRLGATSNRYHVNFYGQMVDGINDGLPSDRLEATWNLMDLRVKKVSVGKYALSDKLPSDACFVLFGDVQHKPIANLSEFQSIGSKRVFAEIPANLAVLKRESLELALAWRLALREVMQAGFANGYCVVDFITVGERYFYVLVASEHWFLYVVECSDGSLYTGICLDVKHRLAAHNSGRGAAYTAARRPVRLLSAWEFGTRSEALKAEAAFKKLTRQVKLRLIKERAHYRDAPFLWLDLE